MCRSGDSTARIWDLSKLAEGGQATSISLPHSSPDDKEKPKDVTTLDWSGNGQLLATGSYDGLARVWSKEGAPLRPTLLLPWALHPHPLMAQGYKRAQRAAADSCSFMARRIWLAAISCLD